MFAPFLFGTVVNLTLIDLPGLTKVAVGMILLSLGWVFNFFIIYWFYEIY